MKREGYSKDFSRGKVLPWGNVLRKDDSKVGELEIIEVLAWLILRPE